MAARFSNLGTQFYRRSIVAVVFLSPLEIVRTVVALAGNSDTIKYAIRVRYKYMEWKVCGCMTPKPSLSKPINRIKYTIRVVFAARSCIVSTIDGIKNSHGIPLRSIDIFFDLHREKANRQNSLRCPWVPSYNVSSVQ